MMKFRLIIMVFLQFAVWGAYLICMGTFLHKTGYAGYIGVFYSLIGIVSLFMPAIVGIIADRYIQAQKSYGICHLISAAAMIALGIYGNRTGNQAQISYLLVLFSLAISFYMPSIALSYSVAYNALEQNGLSPIKNFPPIRTFGTIGFIASMWVVDLLGFQANANQFLLSGILGVILGIYAFSLPECKTAQKNAKKSISEILGLDAFKLFRNSQTAMFLIFSALISMCLQVTNGFANPFLTSFEAIDEFADTFGVKHANILLSLSQISETLCILLIPFFLQKFGIKKVVLIATVAWVLRFALFGLGDPDKGVWLFILSCIVYGVAFDFFNISSSLYINQTTEKKIRSSAQGLLLLMTNGIGTTAGTLLAQVVININVNSVSETDPMGRWAGWSLSWYIFAAYALVLTIAFALLFKYKHISPQK